MLNIFDDNFIELKNNSDLSYEHFCKKFYTNNLSNTELKELDNLITSLLKDFPQLYPYIVEKTPDNYQRNKNSDNKHLQSMFETKVQNGKFNSDTIKPYFSKEYTNKFIKENPNLSSNDEENLLIRNILRELSKEVTITDLQNEVYKILKHHFLHKDLDYLAELITHEIYFRTKVPDEYVWTEEFENFESACDDFFNSFEKKLTKNAINMLKKGKGDEEVSQYLKLHLFK